MVVTRTRVHVTTHTQCVSCYNVRMRTC